MTLVFHTLLQAMINKFKFALLVVSFLQILTGCAQINSKSETKEKTVSAITITKTVSKKDTVINKSYEGLRVPVTLKYSKLSKAQILVLPGWNYPDTQWCSKTNLCKISNEKGYDLLFVEMQRSVYLDTYFKETRNDYRKFPTRKWLMDSVVKLLIHQSLLDSSKPIFVMGLSTGGRGAAILGLENPGIFAALATLSGDFDPEYQKDDPLMINSLGAFTKFPERWKGNNNLMKRIKEFKIPIYIGHGMSDKVCPVKQSTRFADSLIKHVPGLQVKTHFPQKMGHDYVYWNSEVPAVIAFFDSVINTQKP